MSGIAIAVDSPNPQIVSGSSHKSGNCRSGSAGGTQIAIIAVVPLGCGSRAILNIALIGAVPDLIMVEICVACGIPTQSYRSGCVCCRLETAKTRRRAIVYDECGRGLGCSRASTVIRCDAYLGAGSVGGRFIGLRSPSRTNRISAGRGCDISCHITYLVHIVVLNIGCTVSGGCISETLGDGCLVPSGSDIIFDQGLQRVVIVIVIDGKLNSHFAGAIGCGRTAHGACDRLGIERPIQIVPSVNGSCGIDGVNDRASATCVGVFYVYIIYGRRAGDVQGPLIAIGITAESNKISGATG